MLLESIVPMETIERLRAVTKLMVERSRSFNQSDAVFDLEPGHSAETPRLRRLSSPIVIIPPPRQQKQISCFAEYVSD